MEQNQEGYYRNHQRNIGNYQDYDYNPNQYYPQFDETGES